MESKELAIGTRVKIVNEKVKEKYKGIYRIRKVVKRRDGITLYKVGDIKDYALRKDIEVVENKCVKDHYLIKAKEELENGK